MSISTVRHARALAWEYWALSFLQLLFGLTISLSITMLVYGLLATTQGSAYGEIPYERIGARLDGPEGTRMQFGFYWLILAMVASTVIPALGKPAHRYRLPSSSFVLVGVPMLCSMVTTFWFYVVVAFVLNTVFNAGWLIWGPALFGIAAVAWMQAIYWSTCNANGLLAVVGLLSTAAVIAIAGNGMVNSGGTPHLIQELTPLRFINYATTIGVSLAVATLGFSKLRHGQGLPVDRIADWLSGFVPTGKTETPFRSVASAQLWYEFRHRGFVLPAIGLFASILVLMMSCFGETPARIALAIGGIILMVCIPCFGMFFGPRKANGEIGHFFGSRPMTDRQMADAVLKNVTISYATTTLIWFLTSGIVYWIFLSLFAGGDEGNWLSDRPTWLSPHGSAARAAVVVCWNAAMFWTLGWAAVALISSITLGGRKLSARMMVVSVGCAFVVIACHRWIENRTLSDLCFCGLAATFVVALAKALVRAQQLNLLCGWRVALTTLPLYAAAVAIYVDDSERWLNASIYTTMAVFVAAPLVVAPLAVWANRHQ